MLKWLPKLLQNPQPAPDAALPEGWFAPQSAEQLLATPPRQARLHPLRQLTPLPDPLFDSWIRTAIHRFAALAQKPSSLPRQLLTALRSLVQSEYRLNNSECGSDGWLTEDALWLISKTTADRVRGWLLQNGVTGIPENNNRLFDELLAHGIIIPNAGKAIWRCAIQSDSGWSPAEPLTLLRLAPAMIREQPEQRPACFAGNLTTASDATDNAAGRSETPVLLAGQKNNTAENAPTGNEGERFLSWLRIYVMQSDRVNTKTAYVHLVNDDVFLVTPGIFKLYTKETTGSGDNDWQRAQRGFQSLGVHRRGQEGGNVWTCEVKAPGKARPLKGFLVTEPQTIFGENIPVNNPWLKLTLEAG